MTPTRLLLLLVLSLVSISICERSFIIEGDQFVKDGKEFRIISGSMHYFRVMPGQWGDRLRKMKACGLNTISTVIPWNLHQPSLNNDFDFSGRLNISAFIEEAHKQGLLVILRPPPYSCAGIELQPFNIRMGVWGIPNEIGFALRTNNKKFMQYVENFFKHLRPIIKRHLYANGGPVIAIQIENEYGSYGNDKKYLHHLKRGFTQNGIDSIFFSSNGFGDHFSHISGSDLMMEGGATDDVLRTVNFGTGANVSRAFQVLRKYQPRGPLFCTEFWDGWFDHWHEKHHEVPYQDAVKTLEDILQLGGSVNMYMFVGGTNFGFMNGANYDKEYQPTVTSYDYDAPVNESGDPTVKCHAFKEVIRRYAPVDGTTPPAPALKGNYGTITLSQWAPLIHPSTLSVLSKPIQSPVPLTMEAVGQDFGFILYRTQLKGPLSVPLSIQGLHDRALIYLNGIFQGVIERSHEEPIDLEIPDKAQLEILVENMGRINFGSLMNADRKGILEGVLLGGQFQYNWEIFPLPLRSLEGIPFQDHPRNVSPAFYHGAFEIQTETPLDTFVSLPGWTKGVAFINGFNLGRYWFVGPQRTLYLPGSLLRTGENELVLLELEGYDRLVVELTHIPQL